MTRRCSGLQKQCVDVYSSVQMVHLLNIMHLFVYYTITFRKQTLRLGNHSWLNNNITWHTCARTLLLHIDTSRPQPEDDDWLQIRYDTIPLLIHNSSSGILPYQACYKDSAHRVQAKRKRTTSIQSPPPPLYFALQRLLNLSLHPFQGISILEHKYMPTH